MSKSEARHQAVSRKAIVGASSPGKSRSTWDLKAELPTKLIQHLGSDLNPSSLLRTQKHARSKSPTHPCPDVCEKFMTGVCAAWSECYEPLQQFISHRRHYQKQTKQMALRSSASPHRYQHQSEPNFKSQKSECDNNR